MLGIEKLFTVENVHMLLKYYYAVDFYHLCPRSSTAESSPPSVLTLCAAIE